MYKIKKIYRKCSAIEELPSEMGASYLKSYAGIPIEQLENNAAYIQGWLERLRNDKRFIVYASAQAQKATDFILNIDFHGKIMQLVLFAVLAGNSPNDHLISSIYI